jgi:putative nucleotidyltransferase with HDIG domain
MYGERFFSASRTLPDQQDYLKHDLLYFIAATDSNEDTLGHSQFVAAYSLLLAKAVGIESPRRLWDLERGALLHDIGKIAIPDSILKKPGPLTALEKEIIKEHPLIGYEIIREFDFLKNAALVVRHHHERFDGKGYPHGLAGENILLEARVFSIADAIDAITSDRPYRKGRSFKEAFQEIEKCAWSHFDPLLIDVMHSIPKERWLQAKLAALSRLTPPTFH